MFAALFVVAAIVVFALACARWTAATDRDYFKNRVYELVDKIEDKKRLDAKIKASRVEFDAAISKTLREKDDAIAKLRAESDHNYTEGRAAQLELARLRERLKCLLTEEIPSASLPKGYDALKVYA